MAATTPRGIPDTLESLRVPVNSLKPYARNPRRGSVPAIVDSLRRHGQYRPIVVNARTQEVLAGNHTLAAARELGWDEIAATFVDVDEDQAARIVLIDNRANDLAAYDDQELADLLGSLPDLDGTGYIPHDLNALLKTLEATDRAGTDTEPAEPPAEPRSRPGDLYTMRGGHRLLCGDSTDVGVVQRVMAGERADCMWTDPPYGVDYVGKTSRALTIRNDGAATLQDLLRGAFSAATEALMPGAAVYIAHPSGPAAHEFNTAFLAAGWRWHQTLVWVKDSMVLGHSDYHYRHEAILYGYTGGAEGRRGRGGQGWYGDNAQTSVFDIARPKASEEHPTMKPVALVEAALSNSTVPGGLIYEPFAGSGTSLIAAENLGRRCCALELDPAYCDVIVDRWERHTGGKAKRERVRARRG